MAGVGIGLEVSFMHACSCLSWRLAAAVVVVHVSARPVPIKVREKHRVGKEDVVEYVVHITSPHLVREEQKCEELVDHVSSPHLVDDHLAGVVA